jgi:cobalt/nickel transport system permease protein
MAIIPCLIIYPLIYRPILKLKITPRRITIAAFLSVVVGLQLGAFGVVLETLASGITELPFTAFTAIMQPIHLAIGIVEGIVTAAILCFIYQFRKDILVSPLGNQIAGRTSKKKFFIIMISATLVTGGILSAFASAYPDGLEWSIMKVTEDKEITASSEVHNTMQTIQDSTAIFPDYELKQTGNNASGGGTGLAGIVGGMITLAFAGIAGGIIFLLKKNRRSLERSK